MMKLTEEQKQKRRDYYKNNREKCKEMHKNYYENNKEKFSEYAKKYYQIRREEIIIRTGDYYKKNKESVSKKRKEFYWQNRIENILKQRKYYENNKEKILLKASKLWIEKPEVISAWKKKYRAKYPEKEKARNLAKYHVEIPKGQMCELCKLNKATDRHHEDYSKPFDVKFLCHKCNNNLERIEVKNDE